MFQKFCRGVTGLNFDAKANYFCVLVDTAGYQITKLFFGPQLGEDLLFETQVQQLKTGRPFMSLNLVKEGHVNGTVWVLVRVLVQIVGD
jgi:hypothetical protein